MTRKWALRTHYALWCITTSLIKDWICTARSTEYNQFVGSVAETLKAPFLQLPRLQDLGSLRILVSCCVLG